jgi:hypothetical protein
MVVFYDCCFTWYLLSALWRVPAVKSDKGKLEVSRFKKNLARLLKVYIDHKMLMIASIHHPYPKMCLSMLKEQDAEIDSLTKSLVEEHEALYKACKAALSMLLVGTGKDEFIDIYSDEEIEAILKAAIKKADKG